MIICKEGIGIGTIYVVGKGGFERHWADNLRLQRPTNQKKNTINYHLSRMYPNIVGPRKRK